MARKRVEDTVPALESWDDVNQALATIADNQRTVENFEAAMQNKIDEAKAEAEARSRVFIEATKRLERQIKEFAEAHRDDMDGKKTKTLNFGAVGFRKSTKIKLPKAPTKLAEIIQLLRSKGMDDCVKTPAPSVDKDALRKYPTQDIVAVGASIEVDDVFWYRQAADGDLVAFAAVAAAAAGLFAGLVGAVRDLLTDSAVVLAGQQGCGAGADVALHLRTPAFPPLLLRSRFVARHDRGHGGLDVVAAAAALDRRQQTVIGDARLCGQRLLGQAVLRAEHDDLHAVFGVRLAVARLRFVLLHNVSSSHGRVSFL